MMLMGYWSCAVQPGTAMTAHGDDEVRRHKGCRTFLLRPRARRPSDPELPPRRSKSTYTLPHPPKTARRLKIAMKPPVFFNIWHIIESTYWTSSFHTIPMVIVIFSPIHQSLSPRTDDKPPVLPGNAAFALCRHKNTTSTGMPSCCDRWTIPFQAAFGRCFTLRSHTQGIRCGGIDPLAGHPHPIWEIPPAVEPVGHDHF